MKTKCNKQLLKKLRIKTTYLLKTLLTPSNHHIYFNELEPQRKPESIILKSTGKKIKAMQAEESEDQDLIETSEDDEFFLSFLRKCNIFQIERISIFPTRNSKIPRIQETRRNLTRMLFALNGENLDTS